MSPLSSAHAQEACLSGVQRGSLDGFVQLAACVLCGVLLIVASISYWHGRPLKRSARRQTQLSAAPQASPTISPRKSPGKVRPPTQPPVPPALDPSSQFVLAPPLKRSRRGPERVAASDEAMPPPDATSVIPIPAAPADPFSTVFAGQSQAAHTTDEDHRAHHAELVCAAAGAPPMFWVQEPDTLCEHQPLALNTPSVCHPDRPVHHPSRSTLAQSKLPAQPSHPLPPSPDQPTAPPDNSTLRGPQTSMSQCKPSFQLAQALPSPQSMSLACHPTPHTISPCALGNPAIAISSSRSDKGMVAAVKKRSKSIASLGSSLLASIRERSAHGLLGSKHASVALKSMERKALFRGGRILPASTSYSRVHPKPAQGSSGPAAGRTLAASAHSSEPASGADMIPSRFSGQRSPYHTTPWSNEGPLDLAALGFIRYSDAYRPAWQQPVTAEEPAANAPDLVHQQQLEEGQGKNKLCVGPASGQAVGAPIQPGEKRRQLIKGLAPLALPSATDLQRQQQQSWTPWSSQSHLVNTAPRPSRSSHTLHRDGERDGLGAHDMEVQPLHSPISHITSSLASPRVTVPSQLQRHPSAMSEASSYDTAGSSMGGSGRSCNSCAHLQLQEQVQQQQRGSTFSPRHQEFHQHTFTPVDSPACGPSTRGSDAGVTRSLYSAATLPYLPSAQPGVAAAASSTAPWQQPRSSRKGLFIPVPGHAWDAAPPDAAAAAAAMFMSAGHSAAASVFLGGADLNNTKQGDEDCDQGSANDFDLNLPGDLQEMLDWEKLKGASGSSGVTRSLGQLPWLQAPDSIAAATAMAAAGAWAGAQQPAGSDGSSPAALHATAANACRLDADCQSAALSELLLSDLMMLQQEQRPGMAADRDMLDMQQLHAALPQSVLDALPGLAGLDPATLAALLPQGHTSQQQWGRQAGVVPQPQQPLFAPVATPRAGSMHQQMRTQQQQLQLQQQQQAAHLAALQQLWGGMSLPVVQPIQSFVTHMQPQSGAAAGWVMPVASPGAVLVPGGAGPGLLTPTSPAVMGHLPARQQQMLSQDGLVSSFSHAAGELALGVPAAAAGATPCVLVTDSQGQMQLVRASEMGMGGMRMVQAVPTAQLVNTPQGVMLLQHQPRHYMPIAAGLQTVPYMPQQIVTVPTTPPKPRYHTALTRTVVSVKHAGAAVGSIQPSGGASGIGATLGVAPASMGALDSDSELQSACC